MDPVDFISANKNFQSSINIEYDFGSAEKIKTLISTDTVCRYLEEILADVMRPSPNRAKSLVAPYGTGKSHITLTALSSMWLKDPDIYDGLIEAYRSRGSEFADGYAQFVSDGPRLLPVIISGSSADLRHSLLYALRNALRREGLENLMPKTNFDGALKVLDRWQEKYPDTLSRFEAKMGATSEAFRSRLRNMDTSAYDEFVRLYPEMSSGSSFDAFDDTDVVGIYDAVLQALNGQGIYGIYVVYDEFSKYLEANITSASIEDIKLLQDFAERCTRSTQEQQLHLLLISHKTLTNYIDANLPKNKRDGWNGVSGRFQEVEIRSDPNQAYELISHAIIKDEKKWSAWRNKNGDVLDAVKFRYMSSKSSELLKGIREDYLIYGCYPLHPVSACLLPRLSSKVAQNERTLFTFLCTNGEGSFMRAVESMTAFVSPDVIYDYFEPLIRKEYYSSEIRKIYELARKSIEKVSDDNLCVRIVKTVALIHIVQQHRLVKPTEQTIIDIFSDCEFSREEIETAIGKLINTESVVYLRDSNGYLKLKESSGANIEERVKERAELLKTQIDPGEILNSSQLASAIYPSRYNEIHNMIRYFDCGFIPVTRLAEEQTIIRDLGEGDGAVVAAFPSNADEMSSLGKSAKIFTSKFPMCVVSVPENYTDIEKYLYRFAAAKALKNEAGDDGVLVEEYGIVLDDCSEIISDYVEGYFRPELRRAKFFARGREVEGISRRRKLSDLLSDLCEETFPYTPSITHETLNKNDMTGAGRSSRSKLIGALCATHIEPNLGIVGSGQEMAMASSALRATKIIEDFDSPVVNLRPEDENIRRMLDVIDRFIVNANGETFDKLYAKLTGQEEKIGMKKGPIPIYLALVLRNHSDEVIIEHHGEEKMFGASLLQDIDANPQSYSITPMNWTADKAAYTKEVSNLFGCEKQSSRACVADAIRLWYVALPQLTRNAAVDHTGVFAEKAEGYNVHRSFLKALRQVDSDSNQLLFRNIPNVFNEEVGSSMLLEKLATEKDYCDNYVALSTRNLGSSLKRIFDPHAHKEASLSSVIQDWLDSLSPEAFSYVYSGIANQFFLSLQSPSPDEERTVGKIAKAVTSLRVEDWNDARFEDFCNIVSACKDEIEKVGVKPSDNVVGKGRLSIRFYDGEQEQTKTFEAVEYTRYSKMFRHNLDSCLEDMGGSLSAEEKRQVVFDVLRSLC